MTGTRCSSFASTVVERPTTSPPPEHPASRAGRVGFFLFFREGAIADPTMLERAVAFRAAVDGLEPGAMRGSGFDGESSSVWRYATNLGSVGKLSGFGGETGPR